MQTTTMKPQATLAAAMWRAAMRFINAPAPTREQLRVMQHLERLDDHLLADLGLRRGQIVSAVLHGKNSTR